jgi:hypothetical protein
MLTFILYRRPSLDEQNAQAVLQRLIHWLVRLVNQAESPMVIRKLCSTLVTFFTRAPFRWQRPLFHLICSFRHGDALSVEEVETIDVPTNQLIPALSVAQLTSLYQFSATLADELGKSDYNGTSQARLHVQMEKEVLDASAMMRQGLQAQGTDSVKIRSEALKCFLTWANYAQPIWPTKPDSLQHLQDLLEPAIQCLLLDEGDMDALDVFIDLLESYTSFFQQHHLDAIASTIRSHFGPQLEESLREQGAIYVPAGQLIVSYATAVVEDIVEKPDCERAQVTLPLLAAILKSPGYPGEDDELSTITIEFWNTYIEYVNDEMFSFTDVPPHWAPNAKQITSEITSLLWKKVWTPPGEITKTWGEPEKDAFRSFRTDATDLLVSIYLFLTSDMLQQFIQLALQALQEKQWRALEASLLCLNVLADNVLEDHTSDAFLAPLFNSDLFKTMGDFHTEKIPTQTRRTAIDTLGNYGAYIERHPEVLPDALRFLFASLETAAFANISAKSIAEVCSTCRNSLTGELDGFLAQYQRFLDGPTSDPYTKEKVIGGVAAIIQAMTPESAKVRPLMALLENIEKDVAFTKETITTGGDVELAQLIGVTALQCLTNVGKSLQVPDDVPITLYDDDDAVDHDKKNFWNSEQGKAVQDRITGCFSILEVLGNYGEAIDAACAVLKAGYTETTPGPFVLPPSVTVGFLQQCSAATPHLESVLLTASTLIHQHSKLGSPRIDDEVRAIYQQVVSFAQALGTPSEDPAVGHNIIDVVDKLYPRYADIFLDSPPDQISTLINFTLQAIEAPDPLPKRSSFNLWNRLIRAAGPANTFIKVSPEIAAKTLQVVNAFGPSLALGLVRQIAGLGLRSDIEYLSKPVKALFAALPAQAKAWFEAALWSEHFPPVVQGVGDAEKRRFLQQCVMLRGVPKTDEVMRDFYIACRGLVNSY